MPEHPEGARAERFAELAKTVRELRQRCPWDREQTLASLAKHLVEEAYEAVDAIERGSQADLAGELGDLVVQVIFAAVIAEEKDQLRLDDLLESARAKLIRRHPHVYGQAQAGSAEQVVRQWESIKRQERVDAGRAGVLDDVARGQPALLMAERLGRRARLAGMDWSGAQHVLAKVREELDEAERALGSGDHEAVLEELGDMLLALANVPRFLKSSAEETLRRACDKFRRRFARVEQLAAERRLDLTRLDPAEVEALWQEAKHKTAAHDK